MKTCEENFISLNDFIGDDFDYSDVIVTWTAGGDVFSDMLIYSTDYSNYHWEEDEEYEEARLYYSEIINVKRV
ncbi:hypothetical protein [Escherichia phage BEK6]|nr:hypothetical protein [Escherichia phage BEK6]